MTLPKVPSPNAIILGIGVSRYKIRDWNIQSIARSLTPRSCAVNIEIVLLISLNLRSITHYVTCLALTGVDISNPSQSSYCTCYAPRRRIRLAQLWPSLPLVQSSLATAGVTWLQNHSVGRMGKGLRASSPRQSEVGGNINGSYVGIHTLILPCFIWLPLRPRHSHLQGGWHFMYAIGVGRLVQRSGCVSFVLVNAIV